MDESYGWRGRGYASGTGAGLIQDFICDPRTPGGKALALLREFMSLVDDSEGIPELLEECIKHRHTITQTIELLRWARQLETPTRKTVTLRLVVDNEKAARHSIELTLSQRELQGPVSVPALFAFSYQFLKTPSLGIFNYVVELVIKP
jgi:hypothetical protein